VRAVKRRAFSGLAAVTAAVALAASPALSVAAPPASASAETLVNFVGPKKLKVGKRMTYSFACAVNCDVVVSDLLEGPGGKLRGSLSGSIAAGVPAGVILKPNGPLLNDLKADTGKFKLKVEVTATDPTTGETDTDRRTYRFK
jgi:hypothetical protein